MSSKIVRKEKQTTSLYDFLINFAYAFVKVLRIDFMLTFKRVTSDHQDFVELIRLLDQDLYSRYKKGQAEYDKYNKIEFIDTVIVAYHENQAMACGCFKKYNDTTIEIKRMFVKPEMRGRGIAKRILLELESWGIQQGFSKSILETGTGQPEAINLYEKLGYKRIPNYDQYAGMPESVCMEKNIHLRPANIAT